MALLARLPLQDLPLHERVDRFCQKRSAFRRQRCEENLGAWSSGLHERLQKCACGCGEEVVTPIKPTDWSLTWNGEAATMNPSIGNWSQPCQSHYWIIENRVVWAKKWSPSKIEAIRIKDRNAKAQYYDRFRQK